MRRPIARLIPRFQIRLGHWFDLDTYSGLFIKVAGIGELFLSPGMPPADDRWSKRTPEQKDGHRFKPKS